MTTGLIEIDIAVEAGSWPPDNNLHHLCQKAIGAAAQECSDDLMDSAEVSVVFHNDTGVQTLNCDWREQDKPTNVLSFSANEGGGPTTPLLGDIILAQETITKEAVEQSKAFEDHLSHLLIHGFLHLLGYDHISSAEAEEMEALEIKILSTLDITNPYADTIPVS